MIVGCDHDFVVLTPRNSDEPFELQCSTCGRAWPVGPAVPEVYDWTADPFANLDEDDEAEFTTAEYDIDATAEYTVGYPEIEQATTEHKADDTKEQGETT